MIISIVTICVLLIIYEHHEEEEEKREGHRGRINLSGHKQLLGLYAANNRRLYDIQNKKHITNSKTGHNWYTVDKGFF